MKILKFCKGRKLKSARNVLVKARMLFENHQCFWSIKSARNMLVKAIMLFEICQCFWSFESASFVKTSTEMC